MGTNLELSFATKLLVIIHVSAGILSLISGLMAIIAKKGGKLHRKVGMFYFVSMLVIFITAIGIVVFVQFNFFLLVIAVFSFYMCFTGYRALKRKLPNQVNWLDKSLAYAAFFFGIALIGYGAYISWRTKNYNNLILPLVFGFFLSSNSYKDIKHFKKKSYERLWWWFHHLNFMLTSFIACITAFLVNNIYKVINLGTYNYIFWLLPTVVIVPFIIKWNRYYKAKFKMN